MSAKSSQRHALILDAFSFFFLSATLILFFYGPLNEDTFDLKLAAAVSLGLLVLGIPLSLLINKKYPRSLGATLFSSPEDLSEKRPLFKSFWGWQLLVVLGLMCLVSINMTEASLVELFDSKGLTGARNIMSGLFHPNLSLLPQAILAIIQTIFIAFLATLAAIPIAFILSFFAARNIMSKVFGGPVIFFILRSLFNLLRSIEPVSWAIIFSVWVGVGPYAGMLALFIHSTASLTKMYSEQIECVSEGPVEAVEAVGATYIQTIWFGIVPQVVLPFVSFTIYRWDINVRMATIVGLTGGGGIGTLLFQYQNQANWEAVGTLVIVIALVVWAMDAASSVIRDTLK